MRASHTGPGTPISNTWEHVNSSPWSSTIFKFCAVGSNIGENNALVGFFSLINSNYFILLYLFHASLKMSSKINIVEIKSKL